MIIQFVALVAQTTAERAVLVETFLYQKLSAMEN
jgi:hypothetical protein